jgi:hypothetical protein
MHGVLRCGIGAALCVVACGGGDHARSEGQGEGVVRLDSSPGSQARGAPAAAVGPADLRDPVRVKVTANLGGTRATYEGMGECHYTADASIYEVPATQWSARAGDEAGALRALNLTLWQPKDAGELQVSLGLTVSGKSSNIATVAGAPIQGTATATATRRGAGGSFQVDGTDASGTSVQVMVDCERWTEPVAEGG